MALDLSTLTDYAWSDIAKAAKQAMVTAALGGSQLVINGRTISRITIGEAKDLYQLAMEMSNVEAGDDGTALVQWGQRQ
jgi:hypothetical protein